MCQERKGEENLPVLKTALMHQYNDLKTTCPWRYPWWYPWWCPS